MRRPLAHPLAPVVGAALAGLAYLLIQPATADMAAHAFRAWLFDTEGMTVWNAQWYGGHHVLGYSMLFAPLAAWPGPAWVGALGAVAATAAFVPLAREAAPSPGAATAATWLFAAGVLSNVVIGRMPFTLGIALAVAAWLCAERPTVAWRALAAVLALACVLASPVAGAFLALAAAARAAGSGRDALGLAATLVLPVAVGGTGMALLFPEGGDDRFVATAFWPMLAVSVVGAALLAPGRRALRAGVILYLVVLVAAFAIPNVFGQNALRLPVLLGPPLLLLAPRAGAPRIAIAAVLVALVYLQWLPAVRAVAEAHGDPSTEEAFFADPRAFLDGAVRPGERVEVAFTHNHWEAAHLATAVPLARGWERQLDEKANPLFYDGRPLTPERYHRWLHDSAVRWVALAGRAARLLGRGRGPAARARAAVPAARARVGGLEDLGGPRRGAARVQRGARHGRRPRRLRGRVRRPDRRAPALHALVELGGRVREPRARRLDARDARRRRAGPRPRRLPDGRRARLHERSRGGLAALAAARRPLNISGSCPVACCPTAGSICCGRSCCSVAPTGSTGSPAGWWTPAPPRRSTTRAR